jgi:ATP/maltotriose-dependent transcriptional regulator MalT
LSAPDDVEAQAMWRGVRARLLARGGEAIAAERLAREAVELVRTTDGRVMQATALLDLAAVLGVGGDAAAAAAAAGEAADLFEQKGNVVGLRMARAIVTTPTAGMSAGG